MDPVTAALLLAVASGASEAVGSQVWEGLRALVHHWYRGGTAGRRPDPVARDLAALERDRGDENAAARLAGALVARAELDPGFRAQLDAWRVGAQRVYAGVISGSVVQAHVIHNLSITVPGSAADLASPPGPPVAGVGLPGQGGVPALPSVLIQVSDTALRSPAQPSRALSGLPRRAEGFTARGADLRILRECLHTAGEDGSPVVAVAGSPGVGKTALAVEAGHEAQAAGWFPGGVLFLDLHGYDAASMQPPQALNSVLRALGVAAENIPDELDAAAALYRSQLAEIDEPVLIIADNASAASQVLPLLPGAARHRVLVTSRHTMPQLGARVHHLQVLTEDQAVALLDAALRVADPSDDRITGHHDDAARVARSCDCLPLALQIAAALLVARRGLTVADLAAQLADRRMRLDRLDDGERGIRIAFDMSYQALAPENARLFRLVAACPGPDLASEAAIVVTDREESAVRAALDELDRAHLIIPSADRTRWRMHDLLRVYAEELADRNAAADQRELARDRLLEHYRDQAERAADSQVGARADGSAAEGVAAWRAAAQWFEAERLNLMAAAALAADTRRDRLTFQLSAYLLGLSAIQLHMDDMHTFNAISLAAARREGAPADVAGALINSGSVNLIAERYEDASAAFREAVDRLRQIGDPGADETDLASYALSGLGIALMESGQLQSAIVTLREAADEAQATVSGVLRFQVLTRLGTALQRARQSDEAVRVHEQAAALSDDMGNAFYRATALAGLGDALDDDGRYEEAIAAAQHAVQIFRQLGASFFEAGALNVLGYALRHAGKTQDALAARRGAVEAARRAGDPNSEGSALLLLGGDLRRQSLYRDAAVTYGQAIDLLMAAGNRASEADAQAGLGHALYGQKRYQQALAPHERAVALYAEASDRAGQARALNFLGNALRRADQPQAAVGMQLQAMSIFLDLGNRRGRSDATRDLGLALAKIKPFDAQSLLPAPDDQRGQAASLAALAEALLGLGRFTAALEAGDQAAGVFRELDDRDGEAMARNIIGRGLHCLKRFEEASQAHRQALSISTEAGNRQRQGIAKGYLGLALTALRRFDEATTAWEDVAEIFADIGEDEDHGWALDGCGDALQGLGRYEEAAALHQEAADILRLTSDRRTEYGAMASLGIALTCLRRYSQAAEAFGRARKLAAEIGEDRLVGAMWVLEKRARISGRWQRLRRRRDARIQA